MKGKLKRIGWVVPRRLPYNKVMASTRLRVYDVIEHLRQKNLSTGFYSRLRRHSFVVFQKAFDEKALSLAVKLSRKKVRIVLDINVNYIDSDTESVTRQQQENIRVMVDMADFVITPSPYLRDIYRRFNDNTLLIEEIIEERFFDVRKEHTARGNPVLLYCGYAVKAKELYLIQDMLQHMRKKYDTRLLLVCERDPCLKGLEYEHIEYDHRNLPDQLMLGDIKISPRDMSRAYNRGHSFTRIGYPMAVGLPVVASPVASYRGSPAILCQTGEEWFEALEGLVRDPERRRSIGTKGREYVQKVFSADRIIQKYLNLFNARGCQ